MGRLPFRLKDVANARETALGSSGGQWNLGQNGGSGVCGSLRWSDLPLARADCVAGAGLAGPIVRTANGFRQSEPYREHRVVAICRLDQVARPLAALCRTCRRERGLSYDGIHGFGRCRIVFGKRRVGIAKRCGESVHPAGDAPGRLHGERKRVSLRLARNPKVEMGLTNGRRQMADAASGWSWLIEGNRRFVTGRSARTSVTQADRAALLNGQAPRVAILSCSDSRVPPEIIFDAGVGELFVVRSAGHVLDPVAFGSLVYAIDHLDAPAVVILGHSDCGAVSAAVSRASQGDRIPETQDELPDVLRSIVDLIAPAVAVAGEGACVNEVARRHVNLTRERFLETLHIIGNTRRSASEVFGAFYDLATGLVERVR